MNVSLTMEVAITHVVYVSIHLEATAAHVNRDMNSKRTVNSSVKVRNSDIFVPCTIVIFWIPTLHFVLQQSNYFCLNGKWKWFSCFELRVSPLI